MGGIGGPLSGGPPPGIPQKGVQPPGGQPRGVQPDSPATGKSGTGLEGLETGDTLKALVVEVLSDTGALLEIEGKAITAKTTFSLSGMEGRGVRLRALGRTLSGEPLLKLEGDQSPDQSADQSADAGLQSFLESANAELQNLTASGGPVRGSASQGALLDRLSNLLLAAGDSKLPPSVKSALENILVNLIKSGPSVENGLFELLSIMAPQAGPEPARTPAVLPDPAFLPGMEGLTGPVLEQAILESGILLEAKLLDLARGQTSAKDLPEEQGPANDPLFSDKDLKALLLKFQQKLEDGVSVSGRDAGQNGRGIELAGRLLKNVRAFQFLSTLTGSLYSFLPVKWEGLKDGQAGFKSGEAGASCLINLDLEGVGRLNVSVFMRNGGFYVTFRVENAAFREALSRETGLLENMLSEKGLALKTVNVTDYEESPAKNHLEFRGASKNLVNIRL
ncbi:MAG: flagellar hook-length control protein FliK [Nitrospiraceae bacterium]|nr:flagellar hook-length control protein FliK [Nitrospiraceae bacterium]